MATPLVAVQFLVGLLVVVYFAEKLVDGTVGTARGFGLSAFLVGDVFIGFDPENLFVGASGMHEGIAGIALGAIARAGNDPGGTRPRRVGRSGRPRSGERAILPASMMAVHAQDDRRSEDQNRGDVGRSAASSVDVRGRRRGLYDVEGGHVGRSRPGRQVSSPRILP